LTGSHSSSFQTKVQYAGNTFYGNCTDISKIPQSLSHDLSCSSTFNIFCLVYSLQEAIHDLSTVNYEASAVWLRQSKKVIFMFIHMLFQFAYHILIFLSFPILIYTYLIIIFLTILISFNPFKCVGRMPCEGLLWHCFVEKVCQLENLISPLRRLIIFLCVLKYGMLKYVRYISTSR
jgi:hypothetical protein